MAAVAEGVGISTIFDEGIVPDEYVVKLRIVGAKVVSHVDVVCLNERKDSRIIAAFFDVARGLRPASH